MREEAGATARCANCEITVDDEAVDRDGDAYCCDGCADGGPCIC